MFGLEVVEEVKSERMLSLRAEAGKEMSMSWLIEVGFYLCVG